MRVLDRELRGCELLFLGICCLCFPLVAVSGHETNSTAQPAIQESIVAVTCDDPVFLELAHLDYDSCLIRSSIVVSDCWNRVEPLIPDLRFGQSDFSSLKNKEKVLGTLFVLEKCVQATILLPDSRSADDGDASEDRQDALQNKEANADSDGPSQACESWAAFIDDARSLYAENKSEFAQIKTAMSENDTFSVIVDGSGNTLVFSIKEDGSVVSVSDDVDSWDAMLADAGLQAALQTDDGVVLTAKKEVTTDTHVLSISFVPTLEKSYDECTSVLPKIGNGICEVERDRKNQVVISWTTRDSDSG